MRTFVQFFFLIITLTACNPQEKVDFNTLTENSPAIQGKTEYLESPYVTAGDRVYMVGHQDGTFPDLGWHIKGEMGGIWNHPIKLMDGFQMDLIWENETVSLNKAHSFVNYPFANKHLFTIADKNLAVERWQFVPDHKEGIVVQLLIQNKGDIPQDFQLQFHGHADLSPTWLGERTQMVDGPDETTLLQELDAWMAKDSLNPWFVLFGADEKSTENQTGQLVASGKGITGSLSYDLSIAPGSKKIINFTIAGSYHSQEEAIATFQDIQHLFSHYFQAKKKRYEGIAARSKLTIPDKKLQETFEWLKYNSDWLVRTVPEVGTGMTAGIPDYPWWFGCDSEYALRGYMAIGQHEVVYKTIALLDSISTAVNGNGRIVHEVSTNGAVFNPGNINETPQFASLIWEIYRWNGNKEFLEKYFPTIQKGLSWLMSENDENQNLLPEGFGMMEIHGLDSEMIDVASYTQRAFADAAKIAQELGEEALVDEYTTLAQKIKEKINREFWSEEFKSYADFIGTDQEALVLIEDAIVRADTLNKPWAVAELQKTKQTILANPSSEAKPFVLHHNWVVNTPMEMGIADEDKAQKALETAAQFVNPFGLFVTGIDRDESAGSDDGSFQGTKAFSYIGAVMTLPTGVQAVAENNYKRADNALDYLKRMTRSFSYALPGSMYEVSPDYGMITQAWNIYAYAVPIIHQFFGIHPMASRKEVIIQPQMPGGWDDAALENVTVGDNEIDLFYKKTPESTWIKAVQTKPDWSLKVIHPKDDQAKVEVIKGSIDKTEDEFVINSVDSTVEFYVKY